MDGHVADAPPTAAAPSTGAHVPPTAAVAKTATAAPPTAAVPQNTGARPTGAVLEGLDAAAAGLLAKARHTLEATRSNEVRPPKDRELCLNGERATELVCWAYLRGDAACSCAGARAHICHRACGGAINAALGGRHICKRASCALWHPEPLQVKAELEEWWSRTRGCKPVWSFADAEGASTARPANTACRGGSRSGSTASASATESAAVGATEGAMGAADGAAVEVSEASERAAADGGGEDDLCRRCTVPYDVQLDRIARHSDESEYVRRFLRAPFLDEWLNDEAIRPLLSMRKCAKEISEAYGAAMQVAQLMSRLPPAHATSADATSDDPTSGFGVGGGAGVAIFDVCCGKGLAGVLLSYLYPHAAIRLFDSNGAMDLAHVAVRPNVSFTQLDLFAAPAVDQLHAAAAATSARHVIAIGTHLCGALSPRLVDIAIRAPIIDALILSPCCLRGALGATVARTAKSGWPGAPDAPYRLLVETLATLCRSQVEANAKGIATSDISEPTKDAVVEVVYDEEVLSPKNAFIVMRKLAVPVAG